MELTRSVAAWTYSQAVDDERALLRDAREPSFTAYAGLLRTCRHLLDLVRSDSQELLALSLRSTAGNYLHAHAANVAVLCMKVGAALGLGDGDLLLLGMGALLHDLGMAPRLLPLALSGRSLSGPERASLRRHTEEGKRLLRRMADVNPRVLGALDAMVGREPGDAWLLHKSVLALCETYEALSHPRSWRQGLSPHQALRAIARGRAGEFGREPVRALLRALSPYPPGSLVRLSSRELGRVVRIRPELPTRPVVEILTDGADPWPWGCAAEILDLSRYPSLSVVEAPEPGALRLQDPGLAARLDLERWWLN